MVLIFLRGHSQNGKTHRPATVTCTLHRGAGPPSCPVHHRESGTLTALTIRRENIRGLAERDVVAMRWVGRRKPKRRAMCQERETTVFVWGRGSSGNSPSDPSALRSMCDIYLRRWGLGMGYQLLHTNGIIFPPLSKDGVPF